MIFSCFSHTLFHLYLSEVTSQHRIIYLSYPLFCRRDRWKWRLVLTHKTKKKKKKKKQKRPSICCWIIISLCWDKNVSKEKKRFEINVLKIKAFNFFSLRRRRRRLFMSASKRTWTVLFVWKKNSKSCRRSLRLLFSLQFLILVDHFASLKTGFKPVEGQHYWCITY